MGRLHCTEQVGEILEEFRPRIEEEIRAKGLEPAAIVSNVIFYEDPGTCKTAWALGTTIPEVKDVDLTFLANSLRVSADEAEDRAAVATVRRGNHNREGGVDVG
jgi:hypothetical protein